jgi:hypothetical protein
MKNAQLKQDSGISFEEVIILIVQGDILDILEHPNKDKYKRQYLYIVNVNNYAYVIPIKDKGNTRHLITIFPSRRYTQIYLRKRIQDDEV